MDHRGAYASTMFRFVSTGQLLSEPFLNHVPQYWNSTRALTNLLSVSWNNGGTVLRRHKSSRTAYVTSVPITPSLKPVTLASSVLLPRGHKGCVLGTTPGF